MDATGVDEAFRQILTEIYRIMSRSGHPPLSHGEMLSVMVRHSHRKAMAAGPAAGGKGALSQGKKIPQGSGAG
jgi:hypothetical protein